MLLVVLAGAVLVFLGFASARLEPDRPLEMLKARWASAPSKFVTIDGLPVHLRDEGPRTDACPLVLIHGTSSSLHTWEAWVAILKARHRVISFDLPGFGLTGPFPDDDYRIEHYTRFVGLLLDRLNVRRATLVGNSLGGRIAWQTALRRPELVERLVLIDSRGYPIDEATLPLAWKIARIPILRSLMTRIPLRRLTEKGVRRIYGDPEKVTPRLIDRYYELALRPGNRRALMKLFQQEEFADWGRIRTIAIPTLILWGRLDPQISPSDAERFHHDIAGSQLVVFDRLGHVPHEEDPSISAEALEAFLARGPARGPALVARGASHSS